MYQRQLRRRSCPKHLTRKEAKETKEKVDEKNTRVKKERK
jgi:hypothetical protein